MDGNDTAAASDPFTKGHLFSHWGMWATYSISNYLGAVMCAILVYGILSGRRKMRSGDVFVIGLCTGCFNMSIPCATQCSINWASGTSTFQHGWIACEDEAFFHVSAIMVQFLSVTAIAVRNYCAVVWSPRLDISVKMAWLILSFIWIAGEGITYALSTISEAYLMPAGAYCFFKFNSPLIYAWFMPIMLASLFVTVFCYARIYAVARQSANKVQAYTRSAAPSAAAADDTTRTSSPVVTIQIAKRSIIWVLVYFVGWFPAVVACMTALQYGDVTETEDLTLAICGSLHSVWVPLTYAWFNETFHRWLSRNEWCRVHIGRFYRTRRMAARYQSHQTLTADPAVSIRTPTTLGTLASQKKPSPLGSPSTPVTPPLPTRTFRSALMLERQVLTVS